MDIDIDCASLHYGMKNISTIESSLSELASGLSGITLDGELSTAGLITKAISTVSNITNTTIPDVKRKLTNAKNILINMDNEAALFFQYVDTGLLDENLNFTDVPLYDQRNYSNIPYSQGTIASSGCGLTAMCMALSYIYNDLLTPDKLGVIANRSSSNNEGRMLGAAKAVGANVTKQSGIYSKELRQLLKEGKQVVVLVRNGGHFVLCTGITDDGRILVNDPYGAWQKSTPYTDADLNKTGGSAWVIDPYANVGNAKTSIGRMKVSSAVGQAIKEANSGSGTVAITSKKYIDGVNKATAAKNAKNWKSIIGPTAIELQGGNQRIGGRVSSGATSQAAAQVATGPADTTSGNTNSGTDTTSTKATDDSSTSTSSDTSSYSYDNSSYTYTYSSGSSSHGSSSSGSRTPTLTLEGALAAGPSTNTSVSNTTTEKIPVGTEENVSDDTSKMSENAKIFAKNNEILNRGANTVETATVTPEKTSTPVTEEKISSSPTGTSEITVQSSTQTETSPTVEVQAEVQPEAQQVQEEIQIQPQTQDIKMETEVVQTGENTAVLGSNNEPIEEQPLTPVNNNEPTPVVNEQPVSPKPEPSSILNNYHPETINNPVIIEEPVNPREAEPVQRPNEPVANEKVAKEKVPNPVIVEPKEDTSHQPVISNGNDEGEIEDFDTEEMNERNKPTIEEEPVSSSSVSTDEKPTITESKPPVEPRKKSNNIATAILTVGAITGVGVASYATYKAIKNKD